MSQLAPGDKIPDLTLPDQNGNSIRLSDLHSKGPLVVFFYPKDETAGCTKEACSFRDSHEVFSDAGATVVGISKDSVASHQQFAGRLKLPYTLLSDMDGAARKAFGLTKMMGLLDRRITFVIDRQGVVRSVFDSMLQFNRHTNEAIDAVKALA